MLEALVRINKTGVIYSLSIKVLNPQISGVLEHFIKPLLSIKHLDFPVVRLASDNISIFKNLQKLQILSIDY